MYYLMSIGIFLVLVSSFSSSYGDFVGNSGDVHVRVSADSYECDRISCPPQTALCEVIKQTAEPGILTRTDTCFNRGRRNVLNQQVFHEQVHSSQYVNVKVVATRNSIFASSSSNDQPNNDFKPIPPFYFGNWFSGR